MSKSWIAPRWWPRDKDGGQIVGAKVGVWFLPEFDQWHIEWVRLYDGGRMLSIGPLRVKIQSASIFRETK